MPILDLRFTNVGPFDDITFEFDEHVNVFVGPNNSGKSTVLMVLGDLVVYPFSIPRKLVRKAPSKFTFHLAQDGSKKKELSGSLPFRYESPEDAEQWSRIYKEIGYIGFIPALRQSTDFRSNGPTVKKKQEGTLPLPEGFEDDIVQGVAFRLRPEELPEDFARREALFQTNASLIRDEAVIESIIELDYRAYRQNDPAIRTIIDKVAAIASEMTEGFPIQFLNVAEDERGLFPEFRTPDGDMPLNVLSQGTQSIIQWLAHLLIGYAKYYDYAPNLEEPGILIIDEIDAHLHPSWQRRIIPTLRHHFPNLQVFCSTHSPLMLAGLRAGQVQLLKRDAHGKVTVSRNETDIVGWSAEEILMSFLDVTNPTDLETDRHINRLQELRGIEKLSAGEAAELEHLRHTVSQDLLGGPIASQIAQLTALLARAKTASSGAQEPKASRKPKKAAGPGKTSATSTSRRTSK